VLDQASTHGTYVNGEKLNPFEAKKIENGDSIVLGTVLEHTSREHLPTELEIGLVEMDVPIEPDVWVTNERPGTTTNSFHPPDSDSEGEDDEPTISLTWKPFVNDIPHLPPLPHSSQRPIDADRIRLPPILHLPGIHMGAVGVPEHSSTSSLNGDAIHHHHTTIIDLTDGSSWVAPGPIHMGGIEATSDRDGEYDEDNEEEDDNKQQSGYALPYGYEAEDKQSINVVTLIPETQVFVRIDDPPITVWAFIQVSLIIGTYEYS
jgi:FHA domain